jgi:predicted lipid-binding transport protein (Tim44 family)
MKRSQILVALMLTVGLAVFQAEAAKRFGGGGNLGKQRAAPTAKEATPAQAPGAPAQQAAPAAAAKPAAAPAAPAAKPSFMSRWGGLLAGLAIGGLLASLFGAQMGPIIGMLLMALAVFGVVFLLYRLFAAKKAPPRPDGQPVQFAGIGANIPERDIPAREPLELGGVSPAAAPFSKPAILLPADFDEEKFVRVAKTAFIRLQAANDAKDLDDIRDFTSPEMFAELSMQVRERGDEPQKTEVVSLFAQVIEAVVEDGYDIASVRFWGLIREAPGANPESFDEVWHVRKKAGNAKDSWLISGIQQMEPAGGATPA